MNNDFQKCMQIAEFAQKNQHDRRQYEYKIFISYVTLLALGIWKADTISIHWWWGIALIWGSYWAYLLWCVRLAVANSNDQARRNWYLTKAEDKLYSRYVRIKSEYGGQSEREIKEVPRFWHGSKGWHQFFGNWSIWFTALIPFLLVIWLIFRLYCCYPWHCVASITIGVWIIFALICKHCEKLCRCICKK